MNKGLALFWLTYSHKKSLGRLDSSLGNSDTRIQEAVKPSRKLTPYTNYKMKR